MAFADETTVSLVPDIYYPVHGRASGLDRRANAFSSPPPRTRVSARSSAPSRRTCSDGAHPRPQLPAQSDRRRRRRSSLFEEAVALCRKHGLLLISDLAYSELTFDGAVAPSALQVPGAKDVTIEFHSFSKTFNMAGSRIGFAVGGRELIDALYAVRTNLGYGTPAAIQAGAAYALDHASELQAPLVNRYRERATPWSRGFRSLGWTARTAARDDVRLASCPRRIRLEAVDEAPDRRRRRRRQPGQRLRPRRRRILPRVAHRRCRGAQRGDRTTARGEHSLRSTRLIAGSTTAPCETTQSEVRMSDDRNFKDEDTSLDPEDVNSGPSDAAHAAAKARLPDPNDVIPVPGAMSPAEVDERAQVVEKLREETGVRRDDDDAGMR